MENSFKTIKQLSLLVGTILTMGLTASAQTTYEVYLCGDGEAVFTPNFNGYTPQPGDQVIWVELGSTNTTVKTVTVSDPVTDDYVLTVSGTGLSTGEHTYNVYVVSASPDECSSDPSEDVSIYKLPETTLTVTAAIEAYCAAASGPDGSPTSSIITADPGNETLPDGVSYTYTWLATQNGTTVDPETIGTVGGSTFTLNTAVAGTYVLTATAAYTVSSGTIKSGTADAGCPVTGSGTVTVTEQPTKPTIGVS